MYVNMCVSAGAISVCYSKESDRATTVISKHTHGYNQTIWLQVTEGERKKKESRERDSGGKTNEGVEIKTLRWKDKMKRAEEDKQRTEIRRRMRDKIGGHFSFKSSICSQVLLVIF